MLKKIGLAEGDPPLTGQALHNLYEVAYAMLEPNRSQKVYQAIARGGTILTGAAKGVLLLPEGDSGRLVAVGWYGFKDDLPGFRGEVVPPKTKWEIGKQVNFLWLDSSNSRLFPNQDMLIIPIGVHRQVTGLLVLDKVLDRKDTGFTDEEFKIFGHFAGIAIQKICLYEEISSKIRHLSNLVVLNEYVTQRGKFEGLLGELLAQVQDISGAEKGGFMLFQEDTQELVLQKPAFGVDDDMINAYRLFLNQGGNAVNVFLSGKPYYSNGAPKDKIIIQRYVEMFGVRNLLTLPVTSREKRIGVLHLLNKRQGVWSEQDVKVMSVMANHIGVVVENAYLFQKQERYQKESRALDEISLELASCLDRDQILRLIADKAQQLLQSDVAGIFLREPLDGEIALIALSSDRDNAADTLHMPPWKGVIEQVLSTGKPVHFFCPRCAHSQKELKDLSLVTGEIIQALLAIPLFVRGTSQGAIVVWRRAAVSYGPGGEDLLVRFANHAAIAIQNARFYDEEKKASEKLAEQNKIINTQKAALEKMINLHNSLMQGLLDGNGIQGIANTLSSLVTNPVAVLDQAYRVVASASQCSGDAAWQAMLDWGEIPESLLQAGCLRLYWARLTVEDKPFRLEVASEFGLTVPRVVVPIMAHKDRMGYIFCLESPRMLEREDLTAFEQAATMCALELMRQQTAYEVAARYTGEFLLDLVTGNSSDNEAGLNRAACLGYDLSNPHQMLVVEIAHLPPDPSSGSVEFTPIRKIHRVVETILRNSHSKTMLVGHGQGFVITIPGDKLSTTRSIAKNLAQEINRMFPKAEVYFGTGRTCWKVTDYPESYREGRRAVTVGKATSRVTEVIAYDALGVVGLLVDAENKAKLLEFAHFTLKPILKYDELKKASLLLTLNAYFRYDGNLQKMASELFLHKNTVRYRLEKIWKLLGTKVFSGDRKLELQLASKILELANPLGNN